MDHRTALERSTKLRENQGGEELSNTEKDAGEHCMGREHLARVGDLSFEKPFPGGASTGVVTSLMLTLQSLLLLHPAFGYRGLF